MAARKKRPMSEKQKAALAKGAAMARVRPANPTGSSKLQRARHKLAGRIAEDADAIYEELRESGDGASLRMLLQAVLPAAEQKVEHSGSMTMGWQAPEVPKPSAKKASKKKAPRKRRATGEDKVLH